MTYIAPTTLPTAVEREDWADFVQASTRRFFECHGSDDELDTVVMLLVPRTTQVPFLGLIDEYDDEETLRGLKQLTLERAREQPPVVNSTGEIVLLYPVWFKDQTHKTRTIALLKAAADVLDARATAVISECWLRGVEEPRGTGQESVMLLLEEREAPPTSFVARIVGDMPARCLGPWRPLGGSPDGLLCGFLAAPVPEGFTAKVNVATVGEA